MIPIALLAPAILKNWRLIVGGLVFVVVSGTMMAFYGHYTGLVADNAQLSANVATLRSVTEQEQAANKAAREALERWKEAEKSSARIKRRSEAVADAARREGQRLNEAFDQTNLSADELAARGDLSRLYELLRRETASRRSRHD